jgi:hypothetical protein
LFVFISLRIPWENNKIVTRGEIMQQIKQPDLLFLLTGDIYIAQRRPGSTQLLINQDYEGIALLDVWNAKIHTTIPFPTTFTQAQVIDGWCLREDGGAVVIFNEEQRLAAYIPLETDETTSLLPVPDTMSTFRDLRYLWEKENLWLAGGKTSRISTLTWPQEQPTWVEKSNLQARVAHTEWVRILDLLPTYRCSVLRVQPDTGDMLYHTLAEEPVVGVVNWKGAPQWSVKAPKEVLGLALAADQLFVLQEYEIHALNMRGEIQAVYPVSEGFHYSCFDTLPAQEERPAALVTIASMLADESRNMIHVYALGASSLLH